MWDCSAKGTIVQQPQPKTRDHGYATYAEPQEIQKNWTQPELVNESTGKQTIFIENINKWRALKWSAYSHVL